MIYNYEGEFLKWINRFIPEIKLMTYASDEELLTALDKIKEYPAFYYSRTDMSIQWNKTVQVPSDYINTRPAYRYYPYLQQYMGTILVENQSAAFKLITKLKLAFNDQPYLEVNIPGVVESEKVKVALWLTGLSVEDVSLPNNKIGATRAVRFAWQSQLLISDSPTSSPGFVERVHLGYALVDTIKDSPLNHPEISPKYHENGYIPIPKN